MNAARILIVDDQREVSRMLRSSLELSGREVEITAVPSGEEALLELNRGPIELLVTDLRLPGLSGIELLERVRMMYPQSQGILITGQPTETVRKQAEALGVVAYLRKPVSVDAFLDAVDAALFRRHAPELPILIQEHVKPRLVVRLETIRYEVEAAAVFLLDRYGKLVVKCGEADEAPFLVAVPALMKAFTAGLQASNLIGAFLPNNLQLFEGEGHTLVLRNVGAYYGLLIHLAKESAQLDVQKMDDVTRIAAADILDFLSSMGDMPADLDVERSETDTNVEQEPMTEEHPDEFEEKELNLDTAIEEDFDEDVGQFWDDAVSSSTVVGKDDTNTLTYDEAMNKGLIADQEE
ncbi:MAG: response regulator [Anaerolineales bacterium]|nr:response regulator [Anaerolineales bacterium]